MAVVPLLVLSAALLVPAAGSSDVSPSVISGIVGGLADVCLKGAKQTVAKEVTTRLQHVEEQLTTLQEQLSAVQQQQTTIHQLPRTLSAAGECPINWVRHNNSCYLKPPGKTTWLEANQACTTFDPRARLVSVHPDNKDRVKTLFETSIDWNAIWIGLFRRHDGSSWAWSDGTPVDYTNWRDGEPNDSGGGEDCVLLVPRDEGKWNDGACSDTLGFLCQLYLN